MQKISLVIISIFALYFTACKWILPNDDCLNNVYKFIIPIASNYLQDTLSINDTLEVSVAIGALYDTINQTLLPLDEFKKYPQFIYIYDITSEKSYVTHDTSIYCFSNINEMELHKACATDGSYCEYFYLCYYELIDDSLKMKVSCHFTKPGMYAFRIFSQPQASHGELFDFTDDCYDFTTIYYNMNGTYNNNYYLLDNIPEEIKRSTLKGQFYEVGGFCFVVKE